MSSKGKLRRQEGSSPVHQIPLVLPEEPCKPNKIVILGPENSGKSTLFHILASSGTRTQKIPPAMLKKIWSQLVTQIMHFVAAAFKNEGFIHQTENIYPKIRLLLQKIGKPRPLDSSIPLDPSDSVITPTPTLREPQWIPEFSQLWTLHPSIRKKYSDLNDTLEWEDNDKFLEYWIPRYQLLQGDTLTLEDLLHCRVSTHALMTRTFPVSLGTKSSETEIIDQEGGKRSARRMWLDSFQDVTLVIYCFPLQFGNLVEDQETPHLLEGINLLKSLRSLFTATVPFLIVFTKPDKFKRQISIGKHSIKSIWPEFTGKTFEESLNFLISLMNVSADKRIFEFIPCCLFDSYDRIILGASLKRLIFEPTTLGMGMGTPGGGTGGVVRSLYQEPQFPLRKCLLCIFILKEKILVPELVFKIGVAFAVLSLSPWPGGGPE